MTSSRPLPPPEVPFTCRPNPTETIDGSTTRRAVRAVTLGVRVGALLSFRMRRQTTPASPTTGLAAAVAAAVAGRSVCLPRPLPPPPFCCLNHRGCGRHAFRLRCLSGAFNDCPGSLPRPAFPPDRPRSRRSAQERQVKAVLTATAAGSAQLH